MPLAEGLRDAKFWLHSLTQADVEKLVQSLPGGGGELRSVKPAPKIEGEKPTEAASGKPFAARYYWAAFVLIGDPE